MSHPSVSAQPTIDNGEALIALHGLEARLRIDDSAANQACLGYAAQFLARESVAQRLADAARALPHGLCLLVKETLRPAAFQDFIFQRRLQRVAAQHPNLQREQLVQRTAQFVAPPWVAGHPTGGAVDLTLCDTTGQELDLGCGYDEDEASSQGRCFSFALGLSATASQHRSILFACLHAQGFVNYPFEWWHWSYGDKYWATMTQAPHAIYGVVG